MKSFNYEHYLCFSTADHMSLPATTHVWLDVLSQSFPHLSKLIAVLSFSEIKIKIKARWRHNSSNVVQIIFQEKTIKTIVSLLFLTQDQLCEDFLSFLISRFMQLLILTLLLGFLLTNSNVAHFYLTSNDFSPIYFILKSPVCQKKIFFIIMINANLLQITLSQWTEWTMFDRSAQISTSTSSMCDICWVCWINFGWHFSKRVRHNGIVNTAAGRKEHFLKTVGS